MTGTLSKGTLFDPHLVKDLISKVSGKSSLAKLCSQTPLPFNGTQEFIFTMDSDIDIVAENGKKTHGGVSLDPIKVIPIKVEYGARVSDEFLYASEEEKINIMKSFNEGFARKLAKGLDLMAFHGINPRTKTASDVIGTNHFDSKVTQTVEFQAGKSNENMEAAVALIQGSEGTVTGVAMDTVFSSDLAQLTNGVNGPKLFPELAWGANPDSINGLASDVNITVSSGTSSPKDIAIVGDFQGMFKWGYAKQVMSEIIKYGDPDNSGKDLKGYNQIYIRAEAFIGWGIIEPKHFVRITKS